MLYAMNFEGRSTIKKKWKLFGALSSILAFWHMFFKCDGVLLRSVFYDKSPGIFLKYIYKFVFDTARSALNGVCRWKFGGKGF